MKKWIFISCLLSLLGGILIVGIALVNHLLEALIFAGSPEAELAMDPVVIRHTEKTNFYIVSLFMLGVIFLPLILFFEKILRK